MPGQELEAELARLDPVRARQAETRRYHEAAEAAAVILQAKALNSDSVPPGPDPRRPSRTAGTAARRSPPPPGPHPATSGVALQPRLIAHMPTIGCRLPAPGRCRWSIRGPGSEREILVGYHPPERYSGVRGLSGRRLAPTATPKTRVPVLGSAELAVWDVRARVPGSPGRQDFPEPVVLGSH
jgi:hypothetical protein